MFRIHVTEQNRREPKGERSTMFGRFGRRHGYRDDWEGWTPPWMEHGWGGPRGPHFFGGHGFFGPQGPGAFRWHWGSPEVQALTSEGAEEARLFALCNPTAVDKLRPRAQLPDL